jgi:hypothetical protein
MKLVLAWLVAALVSPISANALYNLTHEFPDDCAVSSMVFSALPSIVPSAHDPDNG